MTVNSLKRIMCESSAALDAVRPLRLGIRKTLFPLDEDDRMSFGSSVGDSDQLYRPILAAYDDALNNP